jgi:hypothetical protein
VQRPQRLDSFSEQLPLGRDPAAIRRRLEVLERGLERLFVVPGINRPIGLDSIVGLIPVVGDVVTAGLGAYLVWEARNLGLSKFHWREWPAMSGSTRHSARSLWSATCSTSPFDRTRATSGS